MKKTISTLTEVALIITLLFSLASCGNETNNSSTKNEPSGVHIDIEEVYKNVIEKATMPEETIELQKEDLIDYYGIESEKVAECKAVQDACGYKDEIVIIKAVNDDAASEIESMLLEHIDYQQKSMKNYDPAQYKILELSEVDVNGVYVAMFISDDQVPMMEAYRASFK